MDWKAQLSSSIEAAVHEAVESSMEAAVKRSLQRAIEDMRAYTDASKQRLLRQIREIGQDLRPAAATVNPSVKPPVFTALGNDPDMAASHIVDLVATTPATCSTQYPSRAVTSLVPALASVDFSSVLPTRDSAFEESVDERTRRLRHRIQLAEDRARRDPVWAEKMARRHADFRDTIPSTTAPAKAASTSLASAAILTACVVRDGDVELTSPTTCSSFCPGGNSSDLATSMMASMVIGEADVTTACRARDDSVYPMAQPMVMPTPAHVVVVESAPTRATSSVDITPSSRMLTAATTEPATLAALGSDLIMAPPMIRSAVCTEPVPDAPAVMLMQSTLDIADSSGSGAEMSLLVPLHKPEDADTAGMHEDEQLMVCFSMEWPLAIVAVRDVVDDHSFITGMSARSLILAALGVDDSCVTDMYDVLLPLPLKLLEFPLSKSKEPYVSPLLPQCTQNMVTWGTSLNHLHPKYTGTCSDLGYAMTQSISLLPWNPGERTAVSRDFGPSRGIAWIACIEHLNAALLGSYDHHQKLGYSNTRTYFHWLIQLFCSSGNTIGQCFCQDCCMEQVRYLFDKDFLLGYFGIFGKNYQPQYHEASQSFYYSGLVFEGATHLGAKYFPWEIAWLLVLSPYAHSRFELLLFHNGSVPAQEKNAWFRSWLKLLLFYNDCSLKALFGCCTNKPCFMTKFMELTAGDELQRYCSDTRVLTDVVYKIWIHHQVPRGNTQYSKKMDSLSQSGLGSCTMGNILFCHGALVQWNNPRTISLVSIQFWFQYCSTRHESLHGSKKFQWTVAWFLSFQFSLSSLQNRQYCVILLVRLLCPAICEEKWFRFLAVGSSGTGSACVCICSGIVNIKVWPHFKLGVLPSVHYIDHTYCFDKSCGHDLFCDQLHIGDDLVRAICYLNRVKVCFNYDTHRDLGEVKNHQVPWDPGGSTWHRLGVKPNFKEGGMLAINPSHGLGHGLLGLDRTEEIEYKYSGKAMYNAAWIRTASASSLLSPLF